LGGHFLYGLLVLKSSGLITRLSFLGCIFGFTLKILGCIFEFFLEILDRIFEFFLDILKILRYIIFIL